ncbi:hypothetical protein GC175_32080 [bacterium]|nr:hypothetical protein [bacterium]
MSNSSRITDHGSRITDHESRITNHESRITNHESRITNHGSRITDHESRHPQTIPITRQGVSHARSRNHAQTRRDCRRWHGGALA